MSALCVKEEVLGFGERPMVFHQWSDPVVVAVRYRDTSDVLRTLWSATVAISILNSRGRGRRCEGLRG